MPPVLPQTARRRRSAPIDAAVDRVVPQNPGMVIHLHSMPPVQTQDMTTDRLHAILRASEAGQWEDYLALLRDITAGDAAIQADWMQRKSKLLGKPWSLTVEQKGDPAAEGNKAFVEANLKGCRSFMDACAHLLDSTIFPVAVVEKVYARAGDGWRLADLVPVPHDLLDYREGCLRIKKVSAEGTPTGETEELNPMRYLVHRGHLLRSLPDCWGGPGRALVFYWFLAAAGRGWWARGLERDSAPFLIGKYDPARPEDRYAMEAAFADAVQRFGLVISRETEVQVVKDLAKGTAEAHEAFQTFCQKMCSRIVIGQTLTAQAQAQGLGGGQASVQDDVLTNIVAFDDMLLAETLQEQVFIPLLRLNRRGGSPPIISRGVISDNVQARASVLAELAKAGVFLAPDAAGPLSEIVGLPVVIQPPAASPAPALATLAAPAAPGDANEALTRNATAGLARAFGGSLAPVKALILQSTSAADLEQKLAAFYVGSPGTELEFAL